MSQEELDEIGSTDESEDELLSGMRGHTYGTKSKSKSRSRSKRRSRSRRQDGEGSMSLSMDDEDDDDDDEEEEREERETEGVLGDKEGELLAELESATMRVEGLRQGLEQTRSALDMIAAAKRQEQEQAQAQEQARALRRRQGAISLQCIRRRRPARLLPRNSSTR